MQWNLIRSDFVVRVSPGGKMNCIDYQNFSFHLFEQLNYLIWGMSQSVNLLIMLVSERYH